MKPEPRYIVCRTCKVESLHDFACLNAWDTCKLSSWTCRYCKRTTVIDTPEDVRQIERVTE